MKTVATVSAGIVAAAGWVPAAECSPPDIVLILADDLGYYDLGFQGSERIPTPNLDRLASQSVRFTDGHVSASVCSPSRAGIMTGRYQQRFGHEANVPPRPWGMDVDERTLGQALKGLGYRTGLFGKWHLGDEPEQYPTARGFDEFFGLREGHRRYRFDRSHEHDAPGDPHNIEHNGIQVAFEGHLTDWLGDRAVEFIQADDPRPFFAFLSFTAPHAPLEPLQADMDAAGTDDPYAGLVYGLDRNVGKVLQVLEAKGRMENTLVWFLSDNGGTVGQASNFPLGGKKGTEFEGGQRVPFLVSWKNRISPGVYDAMVSSLDIYPPCIQAAGGSLEQSRPLDGADLVPYLTGQVSGLPHSRLFWRKLECAAVRDGDWKLIRVENYGSALYNLAEDIGEMHDLAAQMPEKVDQLRRLLQAWEADKTAPLWEEEEKWVGIRYRDHTVKFETGLLPGRIPDSRMLKK